MGNGDFGEGGGGFSRKASPGKATVLALGRAFPHQLVIQEYLVDGYFKNTSCNDPDLRQKLTRLCKTTTVKTRYVVVGNSGQKLGEPSPSSLSFF